MPEEIREARSLIKGGPVPSAPAPGAAPPQHGGLSEAENSPPRHFHLVVSAHLQSNTFG